MANHRRRALGGAGLALLGVWLVAGTGWFFANRAKATAGKVAAYLHENDLARMPSSERAGALNDLTKRMSELPVEERRKARLDTGWEKWLAAMTEAEKAAFIEATLPLGFKQMLASFEQLPEDKRRKAVREALRELRKAREAAAGDDGLLIDTNRPPELSEELQRKVAAIGLKTFYAQSSAQTKAELAPVLEELQRLMEEGELLWGRRR